MSNNNQFSSKIGLIAATVGSAVGLGSVWRFPAETQANGGAAFLLIYIGCLLLLGIPVMLSEFALGRGGGSDAIGSFKKLTPKQPWWLIGALAIVASYIILSFYMVVAGWTFEYTLQSISGYLYEPISSNNIISNQFTLKMEELILSDVRPLIITFIVILINMVILLFGVQKGIERLSNILMPLLFIMLLIFCGVSLSLPNSSDGINFFLSPDFSKINTDVIISALGQAFFSLSLGMGILITYSSYYPSNTKLVRTSFTVSLLVLLVSIMMGIIIFPAVTSFGLNEQGLAGTTLVFVTLPEVFAQMPLTQLWSTLFFILLFVAAITSTISIAEVSIAFIQKQFKLSRLKSCLIVLLPLFIFSSICSLSLGRLSDYTICGMTIFDAADYFASNILLPICSLLLCIYIGWFAPKNLFKNQLTNNGSFKSYIYPFILFIIRFIAPILISFILISKI